MTIDGNVMKGDQDRMIENNIRCILQEREGIFKIMELTLRQAWSGGQVGQIKRSNSLKKNIF